MPLTMEGMFLLFTLFLSIVHAQEAVYEIQRETPVYHKASFDSRVAFILHGGEKIVALPGKNPQFLRAKVQRKGKFFGGYVNRLDVTGDVPAHVRGEWGFGLGGEYTSLTQNSKTFETADEVQYTTTDYHSTSMAPLLTVQLHYVDFWRLTVANKRTHYTGSAKTNVSGAVAQSVDLQMNFWSALLEKAWMPFESKNFYLGAGVEVARANSITIKLGTNELTSSPSDIPTYLGVLAFAGGTLSLTQSLSLYGEGRFEYIANQQPAIHGLEAALGLVYWP